MIKRLLFLLFCSAACAQGVRFDLPPILNSRAQPIANAQITLCTGVASISGSNCTGTAQSFTDITLGTACTAGLPVTLTNSNVCQATGDALGNAGFWLSPGAYIYCVNAPSTTGKCYNLTVPVGATSAGSIPNLTIAGPSPWIDVTSPTYGAKCDGSTDDTTAFQTALTAANTNKGGVVYVPPNKNICILAGTLNMDQFANVTLLGNMVGAGIGQAVENIRPVLRFTSATAPLISMRSSTGNKFIGLGLEYSNAGFTGCFIDTQHVTSSDSIGNQFIDDNFNGQGTATALAFICGDKSDVTLIRKNSFNNAVNFIRGRASSGTYATQWNIENNYFGIAAGTFTGFALLNPASGWNIIGNDFEIGASTSGIMDETNGSCSGCNFSGNTIGDISASYNGTLFKNAAQDGSFMSGNAFGGGGTNTNFMSFVSGGGGWVITGNVFTGTYGTLFANASNNTSSMTVLGNIYGTVTAFGLGQFSSGVIQDNTGTVNLFGQTWTFGFNSGLQTRNGITPTSAGGSDVGSTALPFGNLWLGTAATNNFKFVPAATAAARIVNIPDPLGTTSLPLTITSGTKALNTASITTATCDAGVAATATGALATDAVDWSFNAAPTATNKYGAFLVVYAVPSANTVTFYTCNPSATTSTPTAMTVNWSVRRP